MRSAIGKFDEVALGKTYDLRLIRRLIPFIKPYALIFLGSVILMMLITGIDLAIPYATKVVIDRYIVPAVSTVGGEGTEVQQRRYVHMDLDDPEVRSIVEKYPSLFEKEGAHLLILLENLDQLEDADRVILRKRDMAGLFTAVGVILVLVVFHFVFSFMEKQVVEYAGQMIMHDLRMDLFDHIQTLSISFFNHNSVGRLVTRVTNDVQNMHEMFTSVITFFFKDIFLLSGIAIVLAVISPKLAFVSLLVLPLVIFASFYFARHARDVYRDLRVKVAQINTRFSETIQGIRIIQLFRHERANRRMFEKLNHDNYLAEMRQVHIFAVFMPVVEVLGAISIAVIIFYGGGQVLSGYITLGSLVVFLSYMKMFFRPVRDIAEKYNILQSALASAERIFLILDSRESLEAHSSAMQTSAPLKIGDIEFSNVSFAYNLGETVLEGISFRVEPGEAIAIVGPTGAGKTSLINLLVRFYDPVSGAVRINGRDLRHLDLPQVRSRIALVMQDPFLFSETIRENITRGSNVLSDEDLKQILESSNCLSFINRLPKGVDTPLFDGGRSLSSGERQLISIARAIAVDPDLIIFDEATSYIDTESEREVQKALSNLMQSRTSFIIAHRLSTARHADRIIVLKGGGIAESGTHQELMEKKGLYHKLNLIKG